MINTDEMMAALLARHPRAARVLLNHGMPCVGCAIYGIPLERLLSDCDAATNVERNNNT